MEATLKSPITGHVGLKETLRGISGGQKERVNFGMTTTVLIKTPALERARETQSQ